MLLSNARNNWYFDAENEGDVKYMDEDEIKRILDSILKRLDAIDFNISDIESRINEIEGKLAELEEKDS